MFNVVKERGAKDGTGRVQIALLSGGHSTLRLHHATPPLSTGWFGVSAASSTFLRPNAAAADEKRAKL